MAGLPTVQVLLDDGTGTFPYDITAFARMVEGTAFKRGRQNELSSVTNGDFALVLDNTDGRFTVGSTIIASPSPIKMDQQIRVKVTANATTVNRFTQAVQSWPVEWPSGGDEFAVASISGTDAQTDAEGYKLRSIAQEEILKNSPTFLYELDEPSEATSASDGSGNQHRPLLITNSVTGTGTAPTFGTTIGFDTGAKFNGDGVGGGKYLTGQSSEATPAGIMLVFSRSLAAWGSNEFLMCAPEAADANGTPSLLISNAILQLSGAGIPGLSVVGNPATQDGLVHVLEIVESPAGTLTMWLDGASVATAAGSMPFDGRLAIGGSPTVGGTFSGTLAHFAAFSAAPTPAEIANRATAILTRFNGESSTARITRLAGYAGLPLGTLDASQTNVAFVDWTGKSVMEALQEIADAELGVVYFDGSGNLVFHNRNRVLAKTAPDVTIDANFLAPGTRFEYDMQGVVNYLEVTAAGTTSVKQVSWNKTSEITNKHGRYDPGGKTYLVLTDAEALDRGNWITNTHGEPAARVGSLVVDVLTMTAAQQAAMLAVEADTWLRVTGLPGQTTGGTTADFIVQGLSEALNADEWTLTLNAANKPAYYQAWILGDATYGVLGSTTKLGV